MSIAFTLAANSIDVGDRATLGALFYQPAAAAPLMARLEQVGFTSVIIDDAGGCLNNLALASQAVSANRAVRVFATHWAGVMDPAFTAAETGKLALTSGGRFGLRMYPGNLGDGAYAARRTDHAGAWRETFEYLDGIKRGWAAHATSQGVRLSIPIRMGGRSGSALHVAGKHADIFEIDPGTPAEVRVLIDRMRSAACHHDRADRIRFALPIRISLKPGIHRWEHVIETVIDQAAGYIELGVSELTVFGLENALRLLAGSCDGIVRQTNNVHLLNARQPRVRLAG